MGTSIHPDNPMPFGRLCPDVDGDQALRVFLALFPDPEIAERPHLVGRKIRLALMMPQVTRDGSYDSAQSRPASLSGKPP
jgi:hypothetical protein